MPSAGAVAVPTIVPLRVPQAGKSSSQIDTNTLIEIKADPGTSIYFTSNGSKPEPFRKNDRNTIKYKGPFLLNQGKRSIKALAVSRNGLSESALVSKTFFVEWSEPDAEQQYEDDDQSFIMDSRPKSSILRRSHQYPDVEDFVEATRTSNSYGALTHSQTFPVGNPAPTVAYNAWGTQPLATMQKTPDYLFHYHMHENRPGFNQPPARQSQPPPPPQHSVRPPVQVSAMGPYAENGGWQSLSVPLAAVLNQNVGTQTVGLFYPTHEQLVQNSNSVQEVRQMKESSTTMASSHKEQEQTMNLSESSPGKGYWKRQVAHICAHMEAFTQRDAEFRADVGKPKMGKITFASVEDDGVDVTVTISFESQTDTPNVRHNKASMARREALLTKSMTSDSDSPYSATKKKKKPITKKLAAKKKSEEEDKLTPEDRQLLKEVGPKGDGDPDAIQEFLDEGADPNCENNNGVPALVIAAMNNQVDALLVLLDAGAKVNTKSSGKKGNTALHEAVLLGPDGQEAIETLLEAGASAKAKNTKGETPYDLAVKNGYESVVALFASSMGQDMLDKMSDSKKEKGSRRREREEKETAAPEVDRKYKEKRPKDKGTVVAVSRFDPQADAEKLRKAMKGFGTDEKAIIEIVTQRDTTQRQKISKQFKQMFGKDLGKEFKSELSGKLLDVVQGLMMTPSQYDAYQLNKAVKGLGTDEDVLIEILCTRSNSAIEAIKEAYDDLYHKDLEEDVADDTSGHFQRVLVSVLQGARPEDDMVDPDKAKADAMDLYKAGEEKWGTDESRFNVILMSRSYPQLRATFEEYARISKNDIEAAIKKEMSGDIKTSMLTVVRCVMNKHKYFADRLYKTMKGAGTDDDTLMRITVSRCEIDMQNIKAEFSNAYGQTLGKFIAGDTSGDYKKILLGLVGGES